MNNDAQNNSPTNNLTLFMVGVLGFIGFGVGFGEGGIFSHAIGCSEDGVVGIVIALIFGVAGAAIPIFIAITIIRKFKRWKASPRQELVREETVERPQHAPDSSLTCSYCGAQYPADTIECPLDQTPLMNKSQTEPWRFRKVVAACLGAVVLATFLWFLFFAPDDLRKHSLVLGKLMQWLGHIGR